MRPVNKGLTYQDIFRVKMIFRRSALVLAALVASLGIVTACGSSRELPHGTDPGQQDSMKLVGSGEIPEGPNGSIDFWLFGGERPYSELRRRLEDMLAASGWKVYATAGLRDAPFSAHKDGDCVLYEDMSIGADSLSEATLKVARPKLIDRVGSYETQLLVTVLWDCGLE
jgi:hypothetical protein